MRRILLAVIVSMFPWLATATEPTGGTSGGMLSHDNIKHVLLVSAGVIGGFVIADLLIGGAVTEPIVTEVVTPAMQEARAAGAVFGRQIAAATNLRDAEARADMLYALVLGTGALLGGWLVSRYAASPSPESTQNTEVAQIAPAGGQPPVASPANP